ncbi:MAG: hypothetical protein KGH63_03850 [Candidatus Micrarchaeota archaeon]|nr:hypothetical protein [Candidatus Micrarchaeota archaeon]
MDEFNSRALVALVLLLVVEAVAYSLKMLAGLPPVTFLLPILAGMGGWWLLCHWRQAAGMSSSAPILQYILLIAGVYLLFGWLFPASGQPQPLSAALAIAMLAPTIGEWVRDHGKFKADKEDEGGPAAAYRPTVPQMGSGGVLGGL